MNELDRQAESLRQRFDRSFWCERIGSYALALDGAKAACEVRTSNAGHALFTGIARPQRAAEIAARLLRFPYYSGWGIRTVAHGEARYNPMSYHNGSIWPHDNALIAQGLARYGPSSMPSSAPPRTCTIVAFRNCIAAFPGGRAEGPRCILPPARPRLGPRVHRFRCWHRCLA